MTKTFINPNTNKQWQITIDKNIIKTCLNGGKIKEIFCNTDYEIKNKAFKEMINIMRKGFIYQNPDALLGEAISHRFLSKDYNGFMPIATSNTKDDFFIIRMVEDFKDEILYHFDKNGNILKNISLGKKRMTYKFIFCPDETIFLNNDYLIEKLSLNTGDITPFANKKNSMKTMLSKSSDFVLYYTGSDMIVYDFKNNKEILHKELKCKKSKIPAFEYYCFGILSPKQSKVAYRISEEKYTIVDLQSNNEIEIPNNGYHAFFSPDDKYFSAGGKFYISDSGKEIENPFPFNINENLSYYDTCKVRINENLIAIQQDSGNSDIKIYDYNNRKLVAIIDDPFIIRQTNFEFSKNNLILHTDCGVVSIYKLFY